MSQEIGSHIGAIVSDFKTAMAHQFNDEEGMNEIMSTSRPWSQPMCSNGITFEPKAL